MNPASDPSGHPSSPLWGDFNLQRESFDEDIPQRLPPHQVLTVHSPEHIATRIRTRREGEGGDGHTPRVSSQGEEESSALPMLPVPAESTQREVYFYFFVNRGSGGRQAYLLLDLEIEELVMTGLVDKQLHADIKKIHVKITPLNDTDIKESRMGEVRILSEANRHRESVDIYCIACGGDGTVIWVIEELVSARVHIPSVCIALLPFGTGNDFSVATGFGRRQ